MLLFAIKTLKIVLNPDKCFNIKNEKPIILMVCKYVNMLEYGLKK